MRTAAPGEKPAGWVAPERFVFLCHLQPGSLLVKAGDRVAAGQPLGRVGNSGNTSEPHVHVHLQDSPDDFMGEGVPLYFWHCLVDGRPVEQAIPLGGFDGTTWSGQTVENGPAVGGRP